MLLDTKMCNSSLALNIISVGLSALFRLKLVSYSVGWIQNTGPKQKTVTNADSDRPVFGRIYIFSTTTIDRVRWQISHYMRIENLKISISVIYARIDGRTAAYAQDEFPSSKPLKVEKGKKKTGITCFVLFFIFSLFYRLQIDWFPVSTVTSLRFVGIVFFHQFIWKQWPNSLRFYFYRKTYERERVCARTCR